MGTLVALDGASSLETFDADRPCTRDAEDEHVYHYTFQFPPGYSAFYLREYEARAFAGEGYTTDLYPDVFKQVDWTVGHYTGPLVGDVSFGVPEDAGPLTSFAEHLVERVGCTECVLAWPPGAQPFTLSAPSTAFRIG